MSTWDTILKRETLLHFPCVADLSNAIWYEHFCEQVPPNPCPIRDTCALRPIYDEYLKMRAFIQTFLNGRDVEAVIHDLRELRELPPDMPDYEEGGRAWRFYNGLADRLEAMNRE